MFVLLLFSNSNSFSEELSENLKQAFSNAMPFDKALKLSRGQLFPQTADGFSFEKKDYCIVMKESWGWPSCDGIEAFVILSMPGVDTMLVEKPDSSGYVKKDDWLSLDKKELKKSIQIIEDGLREIVKQQSINLNTDVKFGGWRTYPQLYSEKNYIYYAYDGLFDGKRIINIKATVLDRQGYIPFTIIPANNNLNSTQIEKIINNVLDSYKPKKEENYSSFIKGDKVAAVGALGVLASLAGVKWGKTIMAVILAFFKKAWFLIFLPFIFLWNRIIKFFKGIFGIK